MQRPGVFKVGIPTLSGTGAEASRTCVMMNQEKKLKLGMNSDYTVFDRLVLDPELTATVPRDDIFSRAWTPISTALNRWRGVIGTRSRTRVPTRRCASVAKYFFPRTCSLPKQGEADGRLVFGRQRNRQ